MSSTQLPADCRKFLLGLADHLTTGQPVAGQPAASTLPPHATACPLCAAQLTAARRNASILAQLQRPVVPAALRSPAFLAGIYARAASVGEATPTGAALAAGLVATAMRQDPGWPELVGDELGAAHSDLHSLPQTSAPGWLWSRIRADVREQRRAQVVTRRWRLVAGLAAASVFVTAIMLVTRQGTSGRLSPVPQIVFEEVDQPFLDGMSATLRVREISSGAVTPR